MCFLCFLMARLAVIPLQGMDIFSLGLSRLCDPMGSPHLRPGIWMSVSEAFLLKEEKRDPMGERLGLDWVRLGCSQEDAFVQVRAITRGHALPRRSAFVQVRACARGHSCNFAHGGLAEGTGEACLLKHEMKYCQYNMFRSLLGWRPSLLGWRPLLVGWRPSLLGWRPLYLL